MTGIKLITGGSRSGKSDYALARARSIRPENARIFFLATAQALDDEMRARIDAHRRVRPPEFKTIEEPLALGSVLDSLCGQADVLVVDCLTLWISNLLGQGLEDAEILQEAGVAVRAMRRAACQIIVVSGEVGSGIVPDNPLARRFRDLLGWTNQRVGKAADEIILMVSGHPLRVK